MSDVSKLHKSGTSSQTSEAEFSKPFMMPGYQCSGNNSQRNMMSQSEMPEDKNKRSLLNM